MSAPRRWPESMRARGAAGVTLIELLIAMSITGIVLAAISAAFFLGFRTTRDTQTQLLESNGAALLSSYFVPDVQNAVVATVGGTDVACGGAAQPVGLVLESNPGLSSVSYFQGAGIDAVTLYRRECSGGVAAPPARVARNLSSAPTFSCGLCGTGWTSVGVVLHQDDGHGGLPFDSSVQATRRVS